MTLIDGDKIITAQLYDDEHEEYTEKKMSIIDFVNAFTDEGVTTADDVLGKIRAEIEKQEKWLLKAGCNTYNVDIAFSSIKSVLAESEVEE